MRYILTGEKCCRKEIVDVAYEMPHKRCEMLAVEIINGRHYCVSHARVRKREIERKKIK